MEGTVIIADDDLSIRTVLTQAVTRAGCRVKATGTLSTLWRWVEEGEGDALILDVILPDGDALDMLPALRKKRPELPVIVVSANNTVLTTIRANQTGAYEYFPKPFEIKDILGALNKALNRELPVAPDGDKIYQEKLIQWHLDSALILQHSLNLLLQKQYMKCLMQKLY